nr:unnamed protein product [Digitaria exilis]
MGRSIAATPGLWYLGCSAGASRHHSSKPPEPQGPHAKKKKKKKAKPSAQHRQTKMKAVPSAQARGPSKLAKTSAHHPGATGIRSAAPTEETPDYVWKLDLAANEIDCFGEEELYPKFDAVACLKSNQMLTKHNVPGSQEKDDFFSLIPDDKKHLIRSLPKLLTVLHKAGYCIHEDFTLDDLVIGGQFKFFLRGHLTLVPCTQKGMDCDYKRAAKVITDMFLISCGDSAMSLIPGEMKHYIHILESGGSRYSNLILTHVALLPLCSRGTVLRKFHDEILEVLPREGLEATKNKILSEIDITSWDTIAKDNKHLSTWFRYRGQQGVASMARCAPWNAQELVASQVHVGVDASMLSTFFWFLNFFFILHQLALLEAGKFIEEKMAFHVDKIGEESLVWCARKSLGSKFVNGDSDLIAKLVVEAVQAVKTTNGKGAVKYPLKGINILKDQNKSIKNSYLLNGYALNTGRASKGLPASVSPARIACLDFSLQKTQTQTNAHVLDSASMQPRNIYERSGANVVLTTKGIDDIALKHFVEAGIVAVRRVRKRDMHHVSKATGATMVTFADFEYEKEFDSSFLGHADLVVEQRICDDDVLLIKGAKNTNKVFIVLGVNDFILHEKDQCLYDALKTVKETLEANMSHLLRIHVPCRRHLHLLPSHHPSHPPNPLVVMAEPAIAELKEMLSTVVAKLTIVEGDISSLKVVPGSGAVEAALSVHLKKIAAKLTSQEQLVVAEFAESLLIIPKVLCAEAARNEAKDATGLLSMLKAYHHASQINTDKKQFSR